MLYINSKNFLFILLVTGMFLPAAPAQPSPGNKVDSLRNVLLSLNKKDTAKVHSEGMYVVKHTSSLSLKFEAYQLISESYFAGNDIERSLIYLFKGKEVAEASGDAKMMAQAYGSIANHYSYLNLTQKARPYLNKAIEQIEKLEPGNKKQFLKALSYLELGNLDFNDRDFAAANSNYKKALTQFRAITEADENVTYHYRRSLYNIGNSYYYMNQPDSSEAYLNKALKVKDSHNQDLKYYIYSTLSEVYSSRKNYQQAIDTLITVLKDPGFQVNSLRLELYLNLANNYKKTGDNKNYILYNEKYLLLNNIVKTHDLKAINAAFDAEQKDFNASISQSRKQNTGLLFVLIAVACISLLTVYFLLKKKSKQHDRYKVIVQDLTGEIKSAAKTEDAGLTDIPPAYTVPAEVEKEILEGLQKFEINEGFRDPHLTLSKLAVQLNTNQAYLSSVINIQMAKNFNTYINELRIHYMCRKIHNNPEYLNYKISYLAEDCGFISHSAFSTIFKKVTGISPSVFLKEEEKNRRKGK